MRDDSVARVLLDLEDTSLFSCVEPKRRSSSTQTIQNIKQACENLRLDGDSDGLDNGVKIVAAYNQASLFCYQAGEYHWAEEIIRKALELCRRQARIDPSGAWQTLALQPAINLGRLSGLRGDFAASKATLTGVFEHVTTGTELVIDDQVVLPAGISHSLEEMGFSIRVVFLTDMVRSYLSGGTYNSLLEFSQQMLMQNTLLDVGLQRRLTEASVLAHTRLLQPSTALAALGKWQTSEWFAPHNDLWVFLKGAYCYGELGRISHMEKTLRAGARLVTNVRVTGDESLYRFGFLYNAAVIAAVFQAPQILKEFFERLKTEPCAVRDENCKLKLAWLAILACPASRRAQAGQYLVELVRTSNLRTPNLISIVVLSLLSLNTKECAQLTAEMRSWLRRTGPVHSLLVNECRTRLLNVQSGMLSADRDMECYRDAREVYTTINDFDLRLLNGDRIHNECKR